MQAKKKSALIWLWLSAVVIVLDQITKIFMTYWLASSEVIPVLPCLNFILTYNSGAAFSFLGEANGWQRWLFVTISLCVSLYLMRMLYRSRGSNTGWGHAALALIIGGAIGNLYDRLTLGYVIDFIDFCIGHWHFATFNIADAAISLGAIMWLIFNYTKSEKIITNK